LFLCFRGWLKSLTTEKDEPERTAQGRRLSLFDGNPVRNYDVIMKAHIIKIGNSQGIRIPKMMLEETKLVGEVELEVHPDGLLIRSVQKPRGNWDAVFKELADNDDDQLLDASPATRFETKEWQW
jgi:antitoxin MazE